VNIDSYILDIIHCLAIFWKIDNVQTSGAAPEVPENSYLLDIIHF
jgi:hypothetical protein